MKAKQQRTERERILVIGSGSIGRRHAANLLKLGHEPVLYDPAQESLAKAPEQCAKETDFLRALGSGCTIALVCSPPHLHVGQARACVERGMHVFIEKPISHTLDGLDELLALAKQKGRIIMTACNLRFAKTFARVKELVERQALGRPLGARITFGSYLPNWRPQSDYRKNYAARPETGGGVILDAGIHELDFARWLFGPARVCASYAGQQGALGIKTEDYAEIVIKHLAGPVSAIHVDYLRQDYVHKGEVLCEHGTISWDFGKNTIAVYDARSRKQKQERLGGTSKEDVNEMYVAQIKHLLSCVRNGSRPLATGEDGKAALQLALEAKRQAEANA